MSSKLLPMYLVIFTVTILFDENVEAGRGKKKANPPSNDYNELSVHAYYQDMLQLCQAWDFYVNPGDEYNNETGLDACIQLGQMQYGYTTEQAILACAPQVFNGFREDYNKCNVAGKDSNTRGNLYTGLPTGDLEGLMNDCK